MSQLHSYALLCRYPDVFLRFKSTFDTSTALTGPGSTYTVILPNSPRYCRVISHTNQFAPRQLEA